MFDSILQPNFDKHAYHYDTATPIQSDTAAVLANQIQAHYLSNLSQDTWLDIGCGTGRLTQAVLSKGFLRQKKLTWYGLDNSANMLTLFEQNLTANFIQDNPTNQGDFLCHPLLATMPLIPLGNNRINKVISSFALHWVGEGNVEQMVAEMGRVLAPNGQIHVAIPVAGSLSALSQRCPNLPIYPFITAENWLINFDKLMQPHGGEWLYQTTQAFSHTYPDVRTLLTALKNMGGTVSHTGSGDLAAVKTIRHYLSDKNPIALDYQVLLVGMTLKKQ